MADADALEQRGRDALRKVARTWLHGAGGSAIGHLPAGAVDSRLEAIDAIQICVTGLLAPLNALCAVDDEAAEALGVLLFKAMGPATGQGSR
jgi:hypothetical protein